MNTNGIVEKHWLYVSFHFLLDAALFGLCFLLGAHFRFGSQWNSAFETYWPAILVGSIIFPSAAYTCGLYSPRELQQLLRSRLLVLFLCYLGALFAMLILFYANFSTRIGRGVMAISASLSLVAVLTHHHVLRLRVRGVRERVAFVVTSAQDEGELSLLGAFGEGHLELVGVICDSQYQPSPGITVLGDIAHLPELAAKHDLQRIVCTNRTIHDTVHCRSFCQLRYSGITVMPLISLCEEIFHCVPLELVTPEWLMNASASPHIFYLKKLKRAFDIITAVVGLAILWPFFALGALAVRVSSKGPVLYRQSRLGRFGRPFEVLKLRTMRVDAESDGPVWARAVDSRVTPVGAFLRKYRIDEIPQLLNVLRGEMSLVGPRPERPEFVETLAREIPHFRERLMVQPGITGWAQVNYPYGASEDDAIRKLEYDLYYAKHMSLFLDAFSLLDTVRIIISGGKSTPGTNISHLARREMLKAVGKWGRGAEPAQVAQDPVA